MFYDTAFFILLVLLYRLPNITKMSDLIAKNSCKTQYFRIKEDFINIILILKTESHIQ